MLLSSPPPQSFALSDEMEIGESCFADVREEYRVRDASAKLAILGLIKTDVMIYIAFIPSAKTGTILPINGIKNL